jgi:hypothetical protein
MAPHSYSASQQSVLTQSRGGDQFVGSLSTSTNAYLQQPQHNRYRDDRERLIMRSAPFASDLSPIVASLHQHSAFDTNTSSASSENGLPPRPLPVPRFGASSRSAGSQPAAGQRFADTSAHLVTEGQGYVQYSTAPEPIEPVEAATAASAAAAADPMSMPADGDAEAESAPWMGDDDALAAAPSSVDDAAALAAMRAARKGQAAHTMPVTQSFLLAHSAGGSRGTLSAQRSGQASAFQGGGSSAGGTGSPTPSSIHSTLSRTSANAISQNQRVPRVSSHLSVRTRSRGDKEKEKEKIMQKLQAKGTSSNRGVGSSKKKKSRRAAGVNGESLSSGLLGSDTVSSSDSSDASAAGSSSSGNGAAGSGTTGPSVPRVLPFSSVYVSRHDVQSQLRHLICHEHYRPMLPPDMPDELAVLLARAWHPLPSQRPAAADFVQLVSRLIDTLQAQSQAHQ